MLHFYKNDLQKETEFVNKILTELKEGGVFVNCILKGDAREKTLKKIIKESPYEWETLTDVYMSTVKIMQNFTYLPLKKGNILKHLIKQTGAILEQLSGKCSNFCAKLLLEFALEE